VEEKRITFVKKKVCEGRRERRGGKKNKASAKKRWVPKMRGPT